MDPTGLHPQSPKTMALIGNYLPRRCVIATFTTDLLEALAIEAQEMIEACIEAYKITIDEKWIEEARRCYDWFLGRNDLNVPLYDYRTAGCRDGLTADGANLNQDAESTLAWLLSLLNLYFLSETTVVNAVLEGKQETLVYADNA
jgi:hypothetical protein